LYGVSAIGPVLTGNIGTPRACQPHAECHERPGDCSYAILHVIMSQWLMSTEVTSRHGYLSGALGGGDAHVGPGLGFAMGPVVTGLVTQLTGSLQTGFVVLCGLTGVGVMAGLLYPSSLQRIEAPTGSCG